jgi:cyclopropane fatty-acyl-phospholipid synthase-like methyltransferase
MRIADPGGAMANLTWDWKDEATLLSALAGSGLGDSLEAAWPELVKRKTDSAQRIARYLDLRSRDVVAEIGAGVGIVTALLSEQVKRVISLDVSESFQRVAKVTAKRRNVEFHLISPGDLRPLRDSGVTKVFSEGCFIHLNLFDIHIYARQVFELLPQGGRFAFDVANADRAAMWRERPWLEHLAAYEGDRNAVWQLQAWHSPRTIRDLLADAGFVVDAVYNPDWMYAWLVARKD